MSQREAGRAKLLFFVTEDWYFCSHRLPLAVCARSAGFDVAVVTRVRNHAQPILDAGCKLIPLEVSRGGYNLFADLDVVRRLVQIYRQHSPDIVHHVGLKPVLYGTIAARFAHVNPIVNTLAGLGWVFSSNQWQARALRPAVRLAVRAVLAGDRGKLILQNADDVCDFVDRRIVPPERIVLIRGSGIHPDAYPFVPEPPGEPTVVLVSRMLQDKGIAQFVSAAATLKAAGVSARFLLVGDSDPENPGTISRGQLACWAREGAVEWLGWRDDVPRLLQDAHVACLPSYYKEGLPKFLLEAAISGRAIVATDVPGCREVVRDGVNGLLVPVRNSAALATALRKLIESPEERARMGRRGRAIALSEFTADRVCRDTLEVYRELLDA